MTFTFSVAELIGTIFSIGGAGFGLSRLISQIEVRRLERVNSDLVRLNTSQQSEIATLENENVDLEKKYLQAVKDKEAHKAKAASKGDYLKCLACGSHALKHLRIEKDELVYVSAMIERGKEPPQRWQPRKDPLHIFRCEECQLEREIGESELKTLTRGLVLPKNTVPTSGGGPQSWMG